MTSLINLPTELLLRIASHLSCSSALEFIQVHRQIRAACHDRVLFRDFALGPHDASEWPEGAAYLEEATVEETIRVACAVEDAVSGVKKLKDIRQWVPHLTALRYPGYKHFNAPYLLQYHEKIIHRPDDEILPLEIADVSNIRFCFLSMLLGFLGAPRHSMFGIETDLRSILFRSEHRSSLATFNVSNNGYQPTFLETGHCNPRAQADGLNIIYFILTGTATIPLPKPSSMPISSLMDIPSFYQNTGIAFSTCHIEKMSSTNLLTGNWHCAHLYDWTGAIKTFYIDIAVCSTLEAEVPPKVTMPRDQVKWVVRQTQTHTTGEFFYHVHGAVSHNGAVELYFDGDDTDLALAFTATITPFGIVGAGPMSYDSVEQYIWLYKKEWCV
jgi:hypothetical protein